MPGTTRVVTAVNGGRFDFDDGGAYCGSWEEGHATGHGVCTGPDNKGEFAGAWHDGFEVSGCYTWPSGSKYCGQWQNGFRHGLGVETRTQWRYLGEWNNNSRGRYGKREYLNPVTGQAASHYLGTWSLGLNDGYGKETYPDGSTYVGMWQRAVRHGYGVRRSQTYGKASRQLPISERSGSQSSIRSVYQELENCHDPGKASTSLAGCCGKAGFVLRANSDAPAATNRRRSLSERSLAMKRSILSNLRIKKQHSTGDIHQKVTSMSGSLRSSGSLMSCTSDDSEHNRVQKSQFSELPEEQVDDDVIETYVGEWKNDARTGFGIAERTDGLKYIGEWADNMKNGYGVTYFKDGTKEQGRYRNNILIASPRRKGLFLRSSRMRAKIEASMNAAERAHSITVQKADIAESRSQTAQERADQAIAVAEAAMKDADLARITCSQYDPNMPQPGLFHARNRTPRNNIRMPLGDMADHPNHVSFDSMITSGRVSMPNQLGNRATQSYQQLPMSNNIHAQGRSEPNSSRIAESIHQIDQDQYSKSFDYGQNAPPPPVQSTVVGSGHIHDPHAGMLYPNSGPSPLHHSGSSGTHDIDTTIGSDGHSASNELRPADVLQSNEMGLSPKANPLRRGRPGGGSMISLSDDHYDQYTLSRNASDATGDGKLRRNRPSLTRQTEVNADPVLINRRSTLASARDRPGYVAPSAAVVTNLGEKDGDRGSLPNLVELEEQGLTLRREDAARLASQRRQEAQRMQEENELMRHNPLRFFFSPVFRAWIIRWRMPILLALFNFVLLYSLIHILSLERGSRPTRRPPPPPNPAHET
uniref:Junctophilin n=1 Tax=Panagrellus redivivus TaxID=6233 RepID=A0A7E4UNT4_PANRE